MKSEQYILAIWKEYMQLLFNSFLIPYRGFCRAEVSVLLIGSNWKWLVLKKLLWLSEPNPVEIPKKLIRIFSVWYIRNVGQWFENGTKPLDSLGLAVARKLSIGLLSLQRFAMKMKKKKKTHLEYFVEVYVQCYIITLIQLWLQALLLYTYLLSSTALPLSRGGIF